MGPGKAKLEGHYPDSLMPSTVATSLGGLPVAVGLAVSSAARMQVAQQTAQANAIAAGEKAEVKFNVFIHKWLEDAEGNGS